MEKRQGDLSFGKDIGEPHRLHIEADVQGQRHRKLFRDDELVEEVLGSALNLLQFFAENPKEILTKSVIQDALNLADFDRSLSSLRAALRDDSKNPRFIETLRNSNGYRFLLDVQRDGELGVEVFPRWRPSIFFSVLNEVIRNPNDNEDLRFVTFFFTCGIRDLGLDIPLKRGARIRIVFIDPSEEWIWKARFGLRKDGMTADRAKAQAIAQIEDLKAVAKRAQKSQATGSLELRLSRSMPSAFIAHSRRRAVTGTFLAPCAYVDGPMIEALHDTEPWEKLYEDWLVRWEPADTVDLLS